VLMKTLPVYLDYNATTPVDPRVLEAMEPYWTTHFGNPSSSLHAYGWVAAEAVAIAREQVASLLGAAPDDVIFTGGATEAINLALKGVAAAYHTRGRHIVTSAIEHRAVLETCRALEEMGFEVTYVAPEPTGRVHPEAIAETLRSDTILVALMWANNETGVLQPVEEVGALVRERGILFFTDAVQAVGKVPVFAEHVDLLACSAHKFYGPKGVGALYVRHQPRVQLYPLIHGGGQEGGLRSGTVNVPGVVGMGKAAELLQALQPEETRRLRQLRDRLEQALMAQGACVQGASVERLPQTSSLTLPGVPVEKLLPETRAVAYATGSACASDTGRPSHVLTAMGCTPEEARSTIRLSLGRYTTEEDVTRAIAVFSEALSRLTPAKTTV